MQAELVTFRVAQCDPVALGSSNVRYITFLVCQPRFVECSLNFVGGGLERMVVFYCQQVTKLEQVAHGFRP